MNQTTIKYIKLTNLLYFIAIILIALVFGKERAIFVDGSNALYDIIADKKVYFGSNRIATFFNYILPLLATYLGMSLKAIVYSLAINYLLLPIATFAFLRYKQTSLQYEIAFLFTFTFFNWQTYYYPIHDYWSGFYILFILYRIVDDRSFVIKNRILHLFWIMLLTMIILFSHISMIVSVFFLTGYLFLTKRIDLKSTIVYTGFLTFIFLFKTFFFKAGYETGFLKLENFKPDNLIQALHADLATTLLPTFLQTNLNFTLLVIGFFILGIFKRDWIKVSLFALFMIAAFFIALVLFKDYEYSIYAEGQIKTITIVLPMIFIDLLFQHGKNKLLPTVITFSYIFSFFILLNGGNLMAAHYNFVSNTCKQFNKTVYFISDREDLCPLEFIVLPRHSIIINQIENNSNTCLFANVNNTPIVDTLNKVTIYENIHDPKQYFSFPKEIQYVNADSIGFDLSKLNHIFVNGCKGHYNRVTGGAK